MSDLFESFKKNMIPLQKVIKIQANLFIETFLDSDNYNYDDDYYSEDFESDTDTDTEKIQEIPKQQSFDEESIKNIRIYSPINCNNEIFSEDVKITNDDEKIETQIIEPNLDINTLTNNLVVLTDLGLYQKLYINYITTNNKLNFEIIIDNSYLPQFSRWYYNQSRVNTINTIDNLIDMTIEQINFYKYSKNEELLNKFNNLLKKSVYGLTNLKITYDCDSEHSHKIAKIINKISEYIVE
jgi:hypothetical protein